MTKTIPTFTVGDCRSVPHPSNHFDLILLLGNSFGYFSEDNADLQVLHETHRLSRPDNGILILDLTDGAYMRSNYTPRSWEWIDDETFVCRERQLSKDGLRLVSREVITSVDSGVIRDQFYQERLYAREELEEMLEGVGFEVLKLEKVEGEKREEVQVGLSVVKELSKRQEDLGMMEHRMLILARKRGLKP
jgi:SAM-dependent methyltransferase